MSDIRNFFCHFFYWQRIKRFKARLFVQHFTWRISSDSNYSDHQNRYKLLSYRQGYLAGNFFSFYLYCLSSERTVGFYLLCMVCYFLVRYFINILFSAKVQNGFRTVNCHYFKSDSVHSSVSDMLRL